MVMAAQRNNMTPELWFNKTWRPGDVELQP
jgi:hypothetical protein